MRFTQESVARLYRDEPPPYNAFAWDDDLRGFGVRCYRSGRKTFILCLRNEHGRKRFFSLGDAKVLTVGAARELAREKLYELRFGADLAARCEARSREVTVSQLADQYFESCQKRPVTLRRYKRVIDEHIHPALGSLSLSEVTLRDLERLHIETMEHTSRHAAQEVGTVLRQMFKYAERHELILASPAHALRGFPRRPMPDFKLTPEEFRRLRLSCESDYEVFRAAFVKLAMYTGRSFAEIRRLQWGDIDFDERTAVIRETVTLGRQVLCLNERALETLRDVPHLLNNPYVLPGYHDGEPVKQLTFAWKRILKRAGLDYFPMTDLRKNFITTLVTAGVSLELVAELVGYKHVGSIMRYAHHQPRELHAAAERFIEVIGARRVRSEDQGPIVNRATNRQPISAPELAQLDRLGGTHHSRRD